MFWGPSFFMLVALLWQVAEIGFQFARWGL